MFDLTVLRSRTGVITSLILAGVAACSSEDPGNPFTGVTTTSSTVTDGTGGAPTTSAATTVATTVATTGAGGGATTGLAGQGGRLARRVRVEAAGREAQKTWAMAGALKTAVQ